MSKAGNWVPLDKSLVKTLGTLNRPYSEVEAMFSHTVNVDCERPWTYRGYAKVWQWSVGKVKRFIEGMMNTSGTVVGRKGNGSGTEVHFIDKGLWVVDEQKVNGSGTVDEHKRVAISNPNPNPNPNPKEKKKTYGEFNNVLLKEKELEKLKEKYPDYLTRIDNLSMGIESKGYKYKSHYATILAWARNDKPQPKRIDTAADTLAMLDNLEKRK